LSSLNSGRQLCLHLEENGLTLSSDIIEYTYIKVFSVSHFVTQDNLPLEVEYRDMGPIECYSGLVLSCSPSVKDARHVEQVLFVVSTKVRNSLVYRRGLVLTC
jgi:hypothetical protein